MSTYRGAILIVCLLLLGVAGCGEGSDPGVVNPDTAALVHDPFSNGISIGGAECSSAPVIELVSPSGQLYPCRRYVVRFRFADMSTTSGTYEVRAGFTQSGLGDTVVEDGIWNLAGGLLTCTATGNGASATGVLDAPSGPQFPGYTRTIKIRFTTGPYKGQTVSYINLFNPV